MSYSIASYTGDGSTTNFAVPFPFINRTHVSVTVNGTLTAFTWITDGLIQITPAPVAASTVRVARSTSQATRLVDFQDATVLTEVDLDTANLQAFYMSQEAFDASAAVGDSVFIAAEVADASASAAAAAASAVLAAGYAADALANSQNTTLFGREHRVINNLDAVGFTKYYWQDDLALSGNRKFAASALFAGHQTVWELFCTDDFDNAGVGEIRIDATDGAFTSVKVTSPKVTLGDSSVGAGHGVSVLGDLSVDPFGAFGHKIYAPFTNSDPTIATVFQYTDGASVNADTWIGTAPLGTNTVSGIQLFNGATANVGALEISAGTTRHLIDTSKHGSGSFLPLRIGGNGVIQVDFLASRLLLGGATDDTVTKFQFHGTALFDDNFSMTGVAKRFLADFSNATVNSRFSFQSSTVNGDTRVQFVPNGSSQIAGIDALNAATPTNAAKFQFLSGAAAMIINTAHNGSGTTLPLQVQVDGTTKLQLLAAGRLLLGGATDDTTTAVQIHGSAYADGSLSLVNSDLSKARTVTFNGEIDDGNSSTTKTIDFTTGQYHKVTMTGNCTFTFTAPIGPAVVHLKMTQDGTGSRTMTLPAGKWPGSYAAGDKLLSTAIGAIDVLTAKWDGAAWFYTLSKAWA